MLLYAVLVMGSGLILGLIAGMFLAQSVGDKAEERLAEVRTESFKLGRKCGRSGIGGYRVIGDPTVRSYVKNHLGGLTVSEVASHLQHVGLDKFFGEVTKHAVANELNVYLSMDTIVDTIMNVVDVVEKPVVIDGITFNPWAPSKPLVQEVFKVLYF